MFSALFDAIGDYLPFSDLVGEIILLALIFAVFIFLLIKFRKTGRQSVQWKIRAAELKSDNELLDRISRMRTEFYQNMSHDFKTPLTVISTSLMNISDIMEFSCDLKEEVMDEIAESLEHAQREIMRLARMVDTALSKSSLFENAHEMDEIDISKFLHEEMAQYRTMLRKNGNLFSVYASDDLPRVYGNADMLSHVLANLVYNANKYTQNGEVSVQAEESDGYVLVTISDNGAGIKPEFLDQIFERGVSEKGTGLGLSICKITIEEIHKGKIAAQSTYGEGTSITFALPVPNRETNDKTQGGGSEQ